MHGQTLHRAQTSTTRKACLHRLSWLGHGYKGNIEMPYKEIINGFVECMFAMDETSPGKSSQSIGYFSWFRYEGHDEAYVK